MTGKDTDADARLQIVGAGDEFYVLLEALTLDFDSSEQDHDCVDVNVLVPDGSKVLLPDVSNPLESVGFISDVTQAIIHKFLTYCDSTMIGKSGEFTKAERLEFARLSQLVTARDTYGFKVEVSEKSDNPILTVTRPESTVKVDGKHGQG